MRLPKILKADVRDQIIWILLVLYLIAVFGSGNYMALLTGGLSVLVAGLVDYFLTATVAGTKYFPKSAVITGLLIGLNIHPSYGILVFIITPILAILGKSLLRALKVTNLHVFNPAAAGLILSQMFFGVAGLWWGVEVMPIASVIILLFGAGYVLRRLKRLWLPLGFLVGYASILISSMGAFNYAGLINLVFGGTVFLFALIMLPEPQSSPATRFWKYFFGVFVALILIIMTKFSSALVFGGVQLDIFLVSLLAANLISFFIRYAMGQIPIIKKKPVTV